MNERIYTLAEQSGATRWNDELNGNSIDFSPEQFKKFAELIVRECCKVLTENVEVALDASGSPVYPEGLICEHFGVKE